MEHRQSVGHLAALVTVIIWGTTFISTKVLLESFSPVEILFFRFVLGLVALWVAHPRRMRGTTWKQEGMFALAGLCGVCLYYLLENIALNQFGISILGQSVEMNNSLGLTDSSQYMFVDAAYIYIPIVYGVIIGVALLLIYTLSILKAAKNDCLVLVLAFVCIAIDCLVGNQLLSIWVCPLPFYLTCSAAEDAGRVSSVSRLDKLGIALGNPLLK